MSFQKGVTHTECWIYGCAKSHQMTAIYVLLILYTHTEQKTKNKQTKGHKAKNGRAGRINFDIEHHQCAVCKSFKYNYMHIPKHICSVQQLHVDGIKCAPTNG